jgi:hypothetical protein
MVLPIMNSRFLPKILVFIFIGSGTAYSANLNFWKFANLSNRDIKICFEACSEYERIN